MRTSGRSSTRRPWLDAALPRAPDWGQAHVALDHEVAERRRDGGGQLDGVQVGTPQGAVISPLLANIYLHYVYDLWVQHWRCRDARGDVIVVRYADDSVVGFEHAGDAEGSSRPCGRGSRSSG